MESTLISIVMGSQSDWETMQNAASTLDVIGISYECKIVSAHRTPHRLIDFGENVASRGIRVIIAGAGGAAHMPGMLAAVTTIPVLGIPIDVTSLRGVDSLYSILQMPAGVPVATFAIGKPGAINAALFAAAILAPHYPTVRDSLSLFRKRQTDSVPFEPKIDSDKKVGK
ncbi:MAG: 5-(carboxyamino)imidazole ribonucleotide mutase [Alphaproteobacteria bacterium]|nr:5-(carboxyamino)imidazole ribonucleotide mutase [Alphaproteobacteria bacterium]